MTYTLVREERTIEATEEQAAIIEAARGGKENLLINALAGSAKTTTLEFLAKYMPLQPTLSLAFNKRIATEMAERLPGHVVVKTLNSLGHGVWSAAIGKRMMNLEKDKSYKILQGMREDLTREEKADSWDYAGDILKCVGLAKAFGYVPPGAPDHAKRLISRDDFFSNFEDELPKGLVDGILKRSIVAAYQGTIDFDDQLYMPALFGGAFPRFPLVDVDEAQDLSPINHCMLERLAPDRLVAVGDPWQSIYAFRGADTNSMQRLRRTFDMKEMTLSVSFRCPQAIVRNAHFRVPHMKWAEGAIEGEHNVLDRWTPEAIPPGSAIICRNNAPLFKCAMALIKARVGVHLVGRDIGPSLIKALKKLGREEMRQQEVLDAIDKWETEKVRSAKDPGAVVDKAECLRVFASFGDTLRAAIAHAEFLFKSEGPIQLLSGHKSKGLEWDTVYHLDPWRIPSKWANDQEQELNIRYVIETRAKKALYLVTMEGLCLNPTP